MRCPFLRLKCPFLKCECDLLLEKKIFSSEDKHGLPKTRYLQAYVKYLKIVKLAEEKEYKERLGNSGRVRDLLKDCLNDMNMALELRYGKRFRDQWLFRPNKQNLNGNWKKNWKISRGVRNHFWDDWMHELAEIRNHASHKATIFSMVKVFGGNMNDRDTKYFLTAESLKGKITTTGEEVLPYLEKTLEKIKGKLEITEI